MSLRVRQLLEAFAREIVLKRDTILNVVLLGISDSFDVQVSQDLVVSVLVALGLFVRHVRKAITAPVATLSSTSASPLLFSAGHWSLASCAVLHDV